MVLIRQMPKASILNEIIHAKSLTIAKLEKLLGFSNGALRKAIERQSDLKSETIEKIVETFPDLNEEYIRKGTGHIFVSHHLDEATPINIIDETEVTSSPTGSEFRDLDNGMVLVTIPLVDEIAYASYPKGWKDSEFIDELPKHSIVLPRRDKARYRAFVVRGDSMDDGSRKAICSGDIVIGRNIEQDLWRSKLYTNGGKDYIIVHHDGVFIKRIVEHDVSTGIIQCVSTNPDKNSFPDFSVNLSEVYELYIIAKVERDWKL